MGAKTYFPTEACSIIEVDGRHEPTMPEIAIYALTVAPELQILANTVQDSLPQIFQTITLRNGVYTFPFGSDVFTANIRLDPVVIRSFQRLSQANIFIELLKTFSEYDNGSILNICRELYVPTGFDTEDKNYPDNQRKSYKSRTGLSSLMNSALSTAQIDSNCKRPSIHLIGYENKTVYKKTDDGIVQARDRRMTILRNLASSLIRTSIWETGDLEAGVFPLHAQVHESFTQNNIYQTYNELAS